MGKCFMFFADTSQTAKIVYAVPYAVLTSLFARLAFNTGEDQYCVCVHAEVMSQNYSRFKTDRRHFKNSLKNNLSSYL